MKHGMLVNKKITHFFCKSMDWFLCDRDLRHERVKMRCMYLIGAYNENVVLYYQDELVNIFRIFSIFNFIL